MLQSIKNRLKFRNFFKLIVGILSFSFFSIGYAEDPVFSYLQSQKTIRVYLDSGPGFGDQASTATTMQYLHEHGFAGTFEVIYGNLNIDKVTTIFGLSKEMLNQDRYEFNTPEFGNIIFFKIKPFYEQVQKKTN